MDTSDKTVRLTYDMGDLSWTASMVVCDEPKTVLAGCGDNIPDALEDLASEIRLAEGTDEGGQEAADDKDDLNAASEA